MIDPYRQLRDAVTRHCKYKNLFASPEGQEVLKDIMASNFFERTTFVKGEPDTTARNEGRRAAMLDILRYTTINPAELLNLQKQNE